MSDRKNNQGGPAEEKEDSSVTSETTASTLSSEDATVKNEEAGGSAAEGGEGVARPEELSLFDHLQSMLARAMNLSEEKEVPQLLDEVSFEGVARYIKSGKCKNIVTMVGAGISTSAGIPDFRTPGSGLYDNLEQYKLPHPTAIFSIDFFKTNPKPFFLLAKELYPGSFKPTVCHYFMKMLSDKGILLRHYTQNIDTLERVAGLPDDKLLEAHGTFNTSHCTRCRAEYNMPWMKERIFSDEIPTCMEESCGGVVKPDIVFFGESLPDRFSECVDKDFKQCDLLIIMGTSLAVHPFASLTNRVPPSTPRLYINLEKPSVDEETEFLSLLMGGDAGFKFDKKDNIRDVFQQGTCDEGCTLFAEMLGWGQELERLVKKEHDRIDKEVAVEKKTQQMKKTEKETDQVKKTEKKTDQVKKTEKKTGQVKKTEMKTDVKKAEKKTDQVKTTEKNSSSTVKKS